MREQFKYQAVVDNRELARYLGALLEGFEKGTLSLESNGQSMVLKPASLVDLELAINRREGRGRIDLTLSWLETTETGPKEKAEE